MRMTLFVCCIVAGSLAKKLDDDSFQELARVVRELVLQSLPTRYEDLKNWGEQCPVFAGWEWRRDGFRVETKRKWAWLNHGTWRRFSLAMPAPEQSLEVLVGNVNCERPGHFAFDVEFKALLEWFARQAHWERGIQIYSLSAEGTTNVRLALSCELTITVETAGTNSFFRLQPRVIRANIVIDDFRIRRVSKFGGEFAQQATQLARRQLDAKVQELNTVLLKRLNAQIEAKQHKMRVSLGDWTGWPNFRCDGWLTEDGWRNESVPPSETSRSSR